MLSVSGLLKWTNRLHLVMIHSRNFKNSDKPSTESPLLYCTGPVSVHVDCKKSQWNLEGSPWSIMGLASRKTTFN